MANSLRAWVSYCHCWSLAPPADRLTVVFDFKALDIYEGTAADVDGRVTIADEDFYLVGTKQQSFEQMLEQDKAKVDGDADAINKMLDKFRLNSQKQ